MKFVVTCLMFFIFVACEKSELKSFPINKENLNKYVNQEKEDNKADLSKDKHLVNNDYPIEISLYKDKTWYYNLANLGDGEGTWSLEEGKIKLHAKRSLFDMNIDIFGVDEKATKLMIQFSDRFGPRTLEMENRNLP